ncbi:hypothetical protein AA309_20720 [Microvirga vignae]|uniref:Uncharacterized protein n=1 Tax=Microvirga vignae TaxID=1225564 RepID=A0A0H1R826_9HYPH|nr:hypothetical protein AA309_20720 [Microvirga vignae]
MNAMDLDGPMILLNAIIKTGTCRMRMDFRRCLDLSQGAEAVDERGLFAPRISSGEIDGFCRKLVLTCQY